MNDEIERAKQELYQFARQMIIDDIERRKREIHVAIALGSIAFFFVVAVLLAAGS